ncbi:hypothetical protein JF546_16815 [Nitratireductor aquimarinus]|uniref:hypothetical protein n=1 Tax=Nitratireductor TaxID=245876 RepID=UPI001A8F472F|nr:MULTISPECIES: hypothetical protein [Nitratireductor]MBN8244680.1 hypothetical protein [Nitratireductor aquimarinus]MBY6133067.1 hypothetical protein [Nitratireductor aquimarinus]MCA1301910.1 hypothetical protein [Nitratireductor aquimarinus]MCV0350246.1 hypothetical protein [Nitratireductor sp.]
MPKNQIVTDHDKEVVNHLLLELATELDLHYDEEDMFALAPSFKTIKEGVSMLERWGAEVHPDVQKVVARYNRANQ